MNLNVSKLFQAQRILDFRIIENHNLKDAPFNESVLALIVELGECANEWQGFKYWKRNREPRTVCKDCDGDGVWAYDVPCDCLGENKNPLLEEYVDKLHFILSLGINLNVNPEYIKDIQFEVLQQKTITEQFIEITGDAYTLYKQRNQPSWILLFMRFISLGYMLGFTAEQVEEAYFRKNQINHERQEEGY